MDATDKPDEVRVDRAAGPGGEPSPSTPSVRGLSHRAPSAGRAGVAGGERFAGPSRPACRDLAVDPVLPLGGKPGRDKHAHAHGISRAASVVAAGPGLVARIATASFSGRVPTGADGGRSVLGGPGCGPAGVRRTSVAAPPRTGEAGATGTLAARASGAGRAGGTARGAWALRAGTTTVVPSVDTGGRAATVTATFRDGLPPLPSHEGGTSVPIGSADHRLADPPGVVGPRGRGSRDARRDERSGPGSSGSSGGRDPGGQSAGGPHSSAPGSSGGQPSCGDQIADAGHSTGGGHGSTGGHSSGGGQGSNGGHGPGGQGSSGGQGSGGDPGAGGDSSDPDGWLLADLRRIAAEADPTPDFVVEQALAALAVRTLDAELADLDFDSEIDTDPELVRGGSERTLTFTTAGGSVEVVLQITEQGVRRRLIGQLTGAAPGPVTIEHGSGATNADVDEFGLFDIADLPAGLVRLRCSASGGRAVVTSWVRV